MTRVELIVSNTSSQDRSFELEPWGGRYVLSPNSEVKVVIEAPSDPIIAWELTDEGQLLVIRDPAGTLATVYRGSEQVPAL